MISVGKLDCEDDDENDVQYKCMINMPKIHMYISMLKMMKMEMATVTV